MATSLECAALGLQCAEDNGNVMCFPDVDYENGKNNQTRYINRGFNEWFHIMVEREQEYLPSDDYLERLRSGDMDLGVRKEAVDWIWKVHAHYRFGPLSAYLSLNYLDRFLSSLELPRIKAWMMQLLAVACLSLAAKMEETEVPLSLDFQIGESKFVFEAITIKRMELLVLSTLKWKMQAITPFSFMDYFLQKINNDQCPQRVLISQSIQIILGTIRDIGFLEFRPSEIAAAVALYVTGKTEQIDQTEKALSCLSLHVDEKGVLKCLELIQDASLNGASVKLSSVPVPLVPQSPVGVLEAACFSYKSDELTIGSCKRRKLSAASEVDFK